MFTGQRVLKVVLVGLLAFIGAFSLPPVPPAQAAAALVVNGLGDTIAADGVCTLREAITAANTNAPAGDCPAGSSGADMISFSVTGTITLTSQLPDISESLMISGPGADRLTISGNNTVGVLHVTAGSVMLDDLTVANGISQSGGGILNEAMLSVSRSVFRSNGLHLYNGSRGGAIFNQSMLMVADSTFSSNGAESGGAIFNASGADLYITNSTLSGNTADIGGGISNAGSLTAIACTFASNRSDPIGTGHRNGGGINNAGGVITVRDSTFSDNVAFEGIGINSNGGLVSVTNSTFTRNFAIGGASSVINVWGGTLLLTNSTLSEYGYPVEVVQTTTMIKNTIIGGAGGGNFCAFGAYSTISASNNLSSAVNCGSGFTQTTDSALKLGPLQDNGGATKTIALLPGSVAIDAGDAATCAAIPVSNRDQRGIPRALGRGCDIGAFEMSDPIVCGSPGAITATTASYFSDPAATLSTSPGEVVLRKELGAFPKYGAADGRADLVNTGQQATWHFTLPASIDPASVRGAYFQLALVADNHLAVDTGMYALSLWTNGDVRVAGCPAALPHGSPSFGPFVNWVRQGYLTSVGSASYTITIANRSTTGKTDWEGVDWIELHLLITSS